MVAESAGFDGVAAGFEAEDADLDFDALSPASDGAAAAAGFDVTEVTFVDSFAEEVVVFAVV